MSFKPITLISPAGKEYVTDNAVEFNNLVNKGYKSRLVVKPATSVTVKAAAEPKSDSK